MKYETIDQVYAGNAKIRERLKQLIATVPSEKMSVLPDGEKWTAAQIVEHIAIVDEGTMKICRKLLKKAQEAGGTSDGSVRISDGFLQKGREIAAIKVEAPSFVQPSGAMTISDSLVKLDETSQQLVEMRPLFESVGCSEFTFPHPFFGDITAHEWLALKGGHELRHIKQIEKVIGKVE